MNASKRDELVDAIAELRRMFPRFRFAQLVLAVADSAGASEHGEVYEVEDDALLEAARCMIESNRKQQNTGSGIAS
jgi:hypothetical protein